MNVSKNKYSGTWGIYCPECRILNNYDSWKVAFYHAFLHSYNHGGAGYEPGTGKKIRAD